MGIVGRGDLTECLLNGVDGAVVGVGRGGFVVGPGRIARCAEEFGGWRIGGMDERHESAPFGWGSRSGYQAGAASVSVTEGGL